MLNISHLNISKTGLIFDSRSGNSYQINESGSLIINLLHDNKSLEEIAEIMVKTYDINEKQALIDVLDFQAQLSIVGLI
ncbi:MAG: PqqD family peptide modification chaperone [Rickettsiales bacterium]|nr:PqqD family peptide modification chaperone [Rickettsiales bacterium]